MILAGQTGFNVHFRRADLTAKCICFVICGFTLTKRLLLTTNRQTPLTGACNGTRLNAKIAVVWSPWQQNARDLNQQFAEIC